MIAKGKVGLRITLGGLVIWIALGGLAAYYKVAYLVWGIFGFVALLVAIAFLWSPLSRQEPDPGAEEKLAA